MSGTFRPQQSNQPVRIFLAFIFLFNLLVSLVPSSAVLAAGSSNASSLNSVNANALNSPSATTCTAPNPLSSNLIYLGTTTGFYSNTLTLAALLTDKDGNPASGKILTFNNGSQSGNATTDANGLAKFDVLPAGASGSATATVNFAGDGNYSSAQISQSISITKEQTILSYTGSLPGTTVPQQPVSAVLRDAITQQGLAGLTVTFSLGSATATATTNAQGQASANLLLSSDQATSGQPLVISYTGDTNRQGSTLNVPSTQYLPVSFGAVVVRHAPNLSSNARVEGSIRQLNGEYVTLNNGAVVTGDLLVPGTPSLQTNGTVTFGGIVTGTGSTSPTNYGVTLNSGAQLGHLVNRTDPISLSNVTAPPSPTGTRDVSINSSSDSIGNPATLRNLNLNPNVGAIAVPAGTYGQFAANDGSSFVFGVSGSTQPVVYNLQALYLNGTASLQVVGPVVINVNNSVSINNYIGSSSNPLWLDLNIASGGLSLNTNSNFYGTVRAPSGSVSLNAGTTFKGSIFADQLNFNSGSTALVQGVTVPTNAGPTLTAVQSSPVGIAPAQGFTYSLSITNTSSSVSATNVTAQENFYGSTPVTASASLGTLPASSAVITTFAQTAPSVQPKQSGESDSSYLSRLSGSNGQQLWSTGIINFADSKNQSYPPLVVTSTTKLQIPLLHSGVTGPYCIVPGSPAAFTVGTSNLGNGTAVSGTVVVTFPDNTSTSLNIASLAPGATSSSTVTWTVPLSQSTGITTSINTSLIWKDIQNNAYGPIVSSKDVFVNTGSSGNPGNAVSITPVAGTPQSVVVSHTLTTPLQAVVKDAGGNPVSNSSVTFTAPNAANNSTGATAVPGGFFPNGAITATVTTNPSGIATAPDFLSDIYAGPYVVTATVSGVITPATFSLTNLDIPGPPEHLQATAGDAQISLSWASPVFTGGMPVTGYNVYRLQNNSPVKLNASPLTTLSYQDTGLTNNLEYFYMVTAINSVGESGLSFWGRATPQSTQPVQGAPTLIMAVGKSQQTLLEWKANPISNRPDISGYNVYRQDTSNAVPAKVATLTGSQTTYSDPNLTNGQVYTYSVTAVNSAGESQQSNSIPATPQAQIALPGTPKLVSSTSTSTSITPVWQAPTTSAAVVTGYNVYRLDDKGVPVKVNSNQLSATTFNFTDTGLTPGKTYYYLVTAVSSDGEGEISNLLTAITLNSDFNSGSYVPPDVALSNFYSATNFIYSGSSPVQTGVAAGTIDPKKASVIRGNVQKIDGSALSGVTVTILGHPEYGSTLTQSDGWFSLAVNGGGSFVVNYTYTGYIPSQRQVNTEWQKYAIAPTVTLLNYDTKVTSINLGSSATSIQVAQSSVVSDTDGTRQATLLFPSNLTATIHLANGTTQPLSGTVNVRATEYTVGPKGPSAMPAKLPASSGYTYAVEFSLDEAIAAGATGVSFDKPVVSYTPNFLNLPVGWDVPVGYYDRQVGLWIANPNGRIIKILRIDQGKAVLDVDGSGNEASQNDLDGLGITGDELATIATLFSPNQTLWRVSLSHFSPLDFNHAFLPEVHSAPRQTAPYLDSCPTCEGLTPTSNLVDSYVQSVGNNFAGKNTEQLLKTLSNDSGTTLNPNSLLPSQSYPISGTNFLLSFESNWLQGNPANSTLIIPVTHIPAGNTVGLTDVNSIQLTIEVAGRRFIESISITPNQDYVFHWDGKDAFGRRVTTAQIARVTIEYTYPSRYEQARKYPQSFDWPIEYLPLFATSFNRMPAVDTQVWDVLMGGWDTRSIGLGGWTPDPVNFYDVQTRNLYLGNGTVRQTSIEENGIKTIAGTGSTNGPSGDGGQASQARLYPDAMVATPDGTLYIADPLSGVVRKILPSGIISTIAGGGSAVPGDGQQATSVKLLNPGGLALSPDGKSLYISDSSHHLVRKLDLTTGIITTVAGVLNAQPDFGSLRFGNNTLDLDPDTNYIFDGGYSGDGGPGTDAYLNYPTGLAIAPDGSLFIADTNNSRVRRLAPDGTIGTYAGSGQFGNAGDNGLAFQASLNNPAGLTVSQSGNLYIGDHSRVRMVTPSGIITTVVGMDQPAGFSGENSSATTAKVNNVSSLYLDKDNNLYLLDKGNHRIRMVDRDNNIKTIVGNGQAGASGDGGLATQASTNGTNFTFGPDGNIYISDFDHIRKVESPYQGFSGNDFSITSADGAQKYIFDPYGHQLRTINKQTNAVIYQFEYDTSGQLTSIKDGNNSSIITVSRPNNSNSISLVAADGTQTQLQLDSDGYAENVVTVSGSGSSGQAIDNTFVLDFNAGKSNGTAKIASLDSSYKAAAQEFAAAAPTVFGGCSGGSVRSTDFFDLGAVSEQLPCQRVNTSTRNYVASALDLSSASPAGATGLGLTFGRNYNAQDKSTNNKFLGNDGWRFSYQWELEEDSNNQTSTVIITNPSGRRDTFVQTSGNASIYRSSRLTDAVLEKKSDGSFVLTDTDFTAYTFINGKLDNIRDRNQNGVNLTYANSNGTISKISLCLSQGGSCAGEFQTLTVEVNGDGYISKVTDQTGRFVLFGYNNGHLNSVTDANSQVTQLSYDISNRLKTVTAPNGATIIKLTYDDLDRLVTATDGLGQVVKLSSCCRDLIVNGELDNTPKVRSTVVTDIRNNNLYYCYDPQFRTLRKTDQEGGITNYFYDENDHLTKLQDPNGNWTNFSYKLNGLLASTSQNVTVDGAVQTYSETYEYNSRNQPTTITLSPRNSITTIFYDNAGDNPIKTQDPLGNYTEYKYESAFGGRVTSVVTSNGLTTQYTYTDKGYVSQTKDVFETLVEGSTSKSSVTYLTNSTYDDLGRLTFVSDPELSSPITGVNYIYDSLDHVLITTDQISQSSSNQYDNVGNLVKTTNFLGQVTRFSYDANNQLVNSTQEVSAGDISNSYIYYGGNLVAQFDSNHVATFSKYDRLNRVTNSSTRLKAGGNLESSYQYDKLANVVKSTTANNTSGGDQITCVKYDEASRPYEVTSGCGSLNYVTKSIYDQEGNVTSQSKTIGSGHDLVVTATYDKLNRPLSQQLTNANPLGGSSNLITTYSYDDSNNTQTVTDPYGRRTILGADALGRTYSQKLSAGSLNQVTYNYYNPTNKVIRTIDPENYYHDFDYDALHRPTKKTEYSQGQDSSTGLTNTISYQDGAKPRVEVTGPAPYNTKQQYTFDEAGRTTVIQTPNNSGNLTTANFYDPQGNLVRQLNANGQVTEYTYENTGWLLSSTQLVPVNIPDYGARTDTLKTSFQYDQVGNQIASIDAKNQKTTYTYDVLNRALSQSDPLNNTYTFTYDGLNRRTQQKDPKNQTTQYTYDDASYLVKIASAGGLDTTFTNNALGQPTQMTDLVSGATSTTTYSYDALGRMSEASGPQGTVGYGYDSLNRRTSLYSYLPNQQDKIKTILYSYDVWNRVTNMADNSGSAANNFIFSYTGDRLDQIQYPQYDALDPGTRPVVKFNYDAASRLIGVNHTAPSGKNILNVGYVLDNMGNRLGSFENVPGGFNDTIENLQFATYDGANRLVYAKEYATHTSAYQSITANIYDYDLAGNRSINKQLDLKNSNVLASTDYQYDTANRLTNLTTKETPEPNQAITTTTSFGYDANGSQTSENSSQTAVIQNVSTITNTTVTSTYDGRNRLIGQNDTIVSNGVTGTNETFSFNYDGADRRTFVQQRISTHGSSTSTYDSAYLQDPSGSLPVVLRENGYAGNKAYFYLPGSTTPVENLIGPNLDEKTYNHFDGLGSVRVTLNGTVEPGTVLDYFGFSDPFGKLSASTSSDGNSARSNTNNRFAGEQLDKTGLYYDRARYYNPDTGRFTQQDSFNTSNRYTYANNNPSSYTDPTGHFAWFVEMLIAGAVDFGLQYVGNALHMNFNPLDVNWAEVGLVTATGGFGAGFTASTKAGLVVSGIEDVIGKRAAGIVADTAGSVASGLFYRQANYQINGGQGLAPNLFDPTSIALDAGMGLLFRSKEDETGLSSSASCGIIGNSFVAGTPVDSENGLVPIETLKVGDKVWAEDPQTGQSGYYPITFTTNHTASEVVQVTVASGQSNNNLNLALGILTANRLGSTSGSSSGPGPNQSYQETIEATPAHPFWVIGKGWVNAGDLHTGDKLLTKDGKGVYVTNTKLVKKQARVYNFTVDSLHTYFVGKQEWLVHNTCGDDEELSPLAFFRGTTRGYNGNPRDGVIATSVSKNALFAYYFGVEAHSFVDRSGINAEPIILAISASKFKRLNLKFKIEKNTKAELEKELGVDMEPLDFAKYATEIPLKEFEAALNAVGRKRLSTRISNKYQLDELFKFSDPFTRQETIQLIGVLGKKGYFL